MLSVSDPPLHVYSHAFTTIVFDLFINVTSRYILDLIVLGDMNNSSITAPAALLALALMFLKTNNEAVCERLQLPDTRYLLDYVRCDIMQLHVLARALIMWDSIVPSREWVEDQVRAAFHLFYKCIGPEILNVALHLLFLDHKQVPQIIRKLMANTSVDSFCMDNSNWDTEIIHKVHLSRSVVFKCIYTYTYAYKYIHTHIYNAYTYTYFWIYTIQYTVENISCTHYRFFPPPFVFLLVRQRRHTCMSFLAHVWPLGLNMQALVIGKCTTV